MDLRKDTGLPVQPLLLNALFRLLLSLIALLVGKTGTGVRLFLLFYRYSVRAQRNSFRPLPSLNRRGPAYGSLIPERGRRGALVSCLNLGRLCLKSVESINARASEEVSWERVFLPGY